MPDTPSKTPLTDAAAFWAADTRTEPSVDRYVVPAEVACELELEIAELREKVRLYSWVCNTGGADELHAKLKDLERQNAELRADAERYRWLRDTLHKAVGGGVEVNDRKLVYEEAAPGEEVRVYWYPDTPVGFYQSHGATLDAAIDAARTSVSTD